MKTSELIKALQDIDKNVPFDADVVTGDDWMPADLMKVYHEPPHTFLEFDEQGYEEPDTGPNAPSPSALSEVLDAFDSGQITKEVALSSLLALCGTEG